MVTMPPTARRGTLITTTTHLRKRRPHKMQGDQRTFISLTTCTSAAHIDDDDNDDMVTPI